MDINKQPASIIQLNATSLTSDQETNGGKVNRRTSNKKINSQQKVTYSTVGDAVVCTTNNQERQQIIRLQEKTHDPKSVVILDVNNDLDKNDLVKTINCNKNGKLTITEGRLFTDEKLQLIINITEMPAGEIARLNDLLSTPPTYLGKPLGKNVQRLIIIDVAMLQNKSSDLGADCWRRLTKLEFFETSKQMGVSSFYSVKTNKLDSQSLRDRIAEYDSKTKQQATIVNFTTTNNWQTALFGDIALNDKGKIYFHQGYLENISNNETIVLKDAPWDDEEFVSTLTTALRQGGFRSNGKWIKLPQDLTILQQNTSKDQLQSLKQKLVVDAASLKALPEENNSTVCINTKNLETILVNTQLNNGLMCCCDTLTELVTGSNYILVTSKLSDKQWLQLLTRIDKLTNKPTIVDCSQSMVDIFQNQQRCVVDCKLYQHEATAIANYKQQNHTVYQITADTDPLELWQNISLASQNEFVFEQKNTTLLEDLQQGKPVVFYGIETNLAVVSQLETLLANPPYLFIHGKKLLVPNAKITILWSDSAKISNTALWNHELQYSYTINNSSRVSFSYQLLEIITDIKSPLNNKYIPFNQQNFNAIFEQQLQIECDLDRATTPLPIHYRKAANNLIAKYYRDKPEIYGYLKTQINILKPDTDELLVNATALKQWLQQNPEPSRELLAKNFWSLVRHCSPSCFAHEFLNTLEHLHFNKIKPESEAVTILAKILLNLVADKNQNKFKQKLNLYAEDKIKAGLLKTIAITKNDEVKRIATKKLNSYDVRYVYYDSKLKSQLHDALFIIADELETKQPISTLVNQLAPKIEQTIKQHPPQQAIIEVMSLLAEVFPEQLLTSKFANLAESLITGKISNKHKQQRRLKRLVAKLKQHPIIFLQGVAGTGKSHTAKAVAAELKNQFANNMPDPLIISLGPETTSQDLYGGQQLKQKADTDDSYTEFVNGPILNWATSDNPPLLILDEANLVKEGVIAPLAGLIQQPRQLVYAGVIYKLSDKHRVILTGNPESYDGRNMDSAIKNSMLTMHYHEITADTLAELIIDPSLPVNWSKQQKQHATSAILNLYAEYSTDFALSLCPRDLQDVLARIQVSLSYHQTDDKSISIKQINHLVWQSFKEALASAIDIRQQPNLEKLENKYSNKFPQDNSILLVREQHFTAFLDELKQQNPTLQLDSQPIVNLIKNYWLFLTNQNSDLLPRRGIWVEGPAGWGKDVILDAVVTLWEQKNLPASGNGFVHINANPNQWDQLVATVTTAMATGQKLIISELNLLPSRYLEGLFNDVLTKPSTAGFTLFATVNPTSFANRESLSTAFMSRVTQVKLANLTYEQLKNILISKFNDISLVSWLLTNYEILDNSLKQKKSPITITLEDLLTLALDLQNSPKDKWLLVFKKNFGLAIKSIDYKLSDLLKTEEITQTVKAISSLYNESVSKIFRADNITDKISFNLEQYFANYPAITKYRLTLKRITIENGTICTQTLINADNDLELINTPIPTVDTYKLQAEEALGKIKFELSSNKWTILPGISHMDQLCAITAAQPIIVARSKTTGQLLIKLKDNTTKQLVTIDYVIKPNLVTIDKASVAKKLDPVIQDEYLKQLLDTHIFSSEALKYDSCKQLQRIKAIDDPKVKIQELITWANNFTSDRNATTTGNNSFIEVIQQQVGDCKHRSAAFQVLAEYFGVATNIISNSAHNFVEFSLDNKQHWITADLGGATGDLTTINPHTTKENNSLQATQGIKETINIGDESINLKDFLIEEFPFDPNKHQKVIEHMQNNLVDYFIKDTHGITSNLSKILLSWSKRDESSLPSYQQLQEFTSLILLVLFQAHLTAVEQNIDSLVSNKKIIAKYIWLTQFFDITAPLFPILEYLKLDDKYSQEVTDIMDSFYQQMANTSQQQIEHVLTNKLEYDIVTSKSIDLSGTSKTLLKSLQRVALKKKWSYTSTGKSPDINRLSTKKPAFPFNQESKGLKIATFIRASEGSTITEQLEIVLANFVNNQDNNKLISQSFVNYNASIHNPKLVEKSNLVVASFINWLLQTCADDCTILFDDNTSIGDSIATKLYSGNLKINPETNSFEDYTTVLLNCSHCFSTNELLHDAFFQSELDNESLRASFNKSNSLLLTKDFIAKCFQEYLATINWGLLADNE